MNEITSEYLASQGLNASFPHRFASKIKKTDTCWIWVGGRNEHGYGVIGMGGRGTKFIRAHRASWILYRGPIPPGMCVLHVCDHPPCVCPDHLFLGNQVDNAVDAVKKGRVRQGDNHWNVKISDKRVAELRSVYKRHAKNQNILAKRFGISIHTLRRICYGTTRKHVIIQAGDEAC